MHIQHILCTFRMLYSFTVLVYMYTTQNSTLAHHLVFCTAYIYSAYATFESLYSADRMCTLTLHVHTQRTPRQYLSHCCICVCLIYFNDIDAPNYYITYQSAFTFMSERVCYSRVAIDAVLFCKYTMRPLPSIVDE